MKIDGLTIVITGGGSGLGAETASFLYGKGAKVAVLDVDKHMAERVANSIKGLAIQCDVTDEKATEKALKQIQDELGTPRVCINCAGIAPAKRIVGRDGPMSLSEFEKVISVNLIGTFNMMRLTAALMTKLEPMGEDKERGLIINTASIAAYDGQIGQSAYSASKSAICGMTLPAARELGEFNVRVMTIAPGVFATPLLESLPLEVQTRLATNIPFPSRFGNPREYAMLAAQVIENPYLNGEVIRLDAAVRMLPK